MSTNPTPAEVTRETYRESSEQFFARMRNRGELLSAQRALLVREQDLAHDSNVKKSDVKREALEYTSTVTFPFNDEEWAERQARIDDDLLKRLTEEYADVEVGEQPATATSL